MPHRVVIVPRPNVLSKRYPNSSSTTFPQLIPPETEHARSRDHEVAQDAQAKEDERPIPAQARTAETSGGSASLTCLDTPGVQFLLKQPRKFRNRPIDEVTRARKSQHSVMRGQDERDKKTLTSRQVTATQSIITEYHM